MWPAPAQVQELAAHHPVHPGRPAELGDDPHPDGGPAVLALADQAHGLGEQGVAGEDRDVLAVDPVAGRLTAAQVVVVHRGQVVVDERVRVHELDGRGGRQEPLRVLAQPLAAGEREHAADPLAAGQQRVAHRLDEGAGARGGRRLGRVLGREVERAQVLVDHGPQVFGEGQGASIGSHSPPVWPRLRAAPGIPVGRIVSVRGARGPAGKDSRACAPKPGDVSATTTAGVLLIVLPVAFNALFALLAARFDYPDVLRRPTGEVLERFRAGGSGLVLLWWCFALTAVLLAPLAVLVSRAIDDADATLLAVATVTGVLAATVQFLGLVRWPFLVPYLAGVDADPEASPARREAVDVVFQAFNRYLGVAVGEHLGYLLTGAWTILVGAALTDTARAPAWLGVVGILVGAALMVCSLEFVGRVGTAGWRAAERLTPIAYVAWSLWLLATGVALLV